MYVCGCFWAFLVAQMVKNPPVMWETWTLFLGWEDPQRRAWQPTLVFLLGQFHGQRSLAVYSPWGRKELDMTEWLRNRRMGPFMLEWQNWIVVTNTIWTMKSKISIFTIWSFRKFANSWFRGMPLFSIYQIRTFCLCVWSSYEGNAKNASYSSLQLRTSLRGSIQWAQLKKKFVKINCLAIENGLVDTEGKEMRRWLERVVLTYLYSTMYKIDS